MDVIAATPSAFTKAIDVEFTVVADRTTNASSNPEAFSQQLVSMITPVICIL